MAGTTYEKKDENPIPYNDHIMDAMRGLVSMLPRDIGIRLGDLKPNYVGSQTLFSYSDPGDSNNPYDKAFWASPYKNTEVEEYYQELDDYEVGEEFNYEI